MTVSELSSILDKIPENPGRSALMGLAVVGGGVIGGLITGLAAQGGTRLSTGQRLPRWAVNLMRSVGGLFTALLLALFLFTEPGTGGPGGGGGGKDGGTGDRQGILDQPTTKPNNDAPKDRRPPKPDKVAPPPVVVVLRDDQGEGKRWYRLDSKEGKPRYTIEGIEEELRKMKAGDPPIAAVDVLLYSNSPVATDDWVTSLKAMIQDKLKLEANVKTDDRTAPK